MISRGLADTLRSARLALALLLFLALAALLGTVPRQPAAGGAAVVPLARVERFLGIRETFRSPVFLAATALLTVNILFCTASRLQRQSGNRARMLPEAVMHLSLVLVIAGGAAKAGWGVVRTVVVPVGGESSTIFDVKSGRDVPLGFSLRVVRLETEYHPFRARIGLSDTRTAGKIGMAEVAEGRAGAALPSGGEIRFLGVDRETGRAGFLIRTAAASGPISLSLAPGPGSHAEFGGLGFTLVAFRDEEKMVRALISGVRPDGLVTEEWLSPNGGVAIQGASLSLTAWGRDEFGNPFAGFQVSRDPGAPLFWAGCVLLACALPAHFLVRRRRRGGAAGAA